MDDELEVLVLHHQHELMAAKTLESDLDLAFRLQMQEALTASLLPNPSSSSSNNLPSDLHLEGDENTFDLMHLQTLEFDRFQQERKDRDLCQSEMHRTAFDLKRRLHDHSFALEIHQMPDVDWDEHGDNFEKPIDAAAGSSSSSAGPALGEPFRLYFKGMLSGHLVNGRTVPLAAIGVAVCDPLDNVLLKIQKPLPMVAEMSQAVAEMKALIEGLQAAVSLDIKNVDVFSDFLPLVNQVGLTFNSYLFQSSSL